MLFRTVFDPTKLIDFQSYWLWLRGKPGLVLLSVQLSLMTRLYTLRVEGQTLLEVDVETPSWLPVRPKLSRRWVKTLVVSALKEYFGGRAAASHPVCLN